MSPNRVRSQPAPKSAHGSWIKQLREHDALADPMPLTVPDTLFAPGGLLRAGILRAHLADPDCLCLLA